MKNKPQDERDWHERRIEAERSGKKESAASRKTFAERTKKPGEVGLANEARPGLGSRADEADPAEAPRGQPKEAKAGGKPRATPHGYQEPRPAPRNQPSDSMAHELERQTGMSGQSSGT